MKKYTTRSLTFWGALLTATVGAFTIVYSMKSLPEGYLWGWLWLVLLHLWDTPLAVFGVACRDMTILLAGVLDQG